MQDFENAFVPTVEAGELKVAEVEGEPTIARPAAPVRDLPTICGHCGRDLLPHEKQPFFHCNACGCCFDVNGNQREGHPLCSIAMKVEPLDPMGRSGL